VVSHVGGVRSNDAEDGAGAAAGQPVSPGERLSAVMRAVDSPTNWTLVHADDAAARWSALRGWVEWLRSEFGLDHRVVPPCWYLHPALVSVLSALRDQWCSAYDPLNMLSAPSAWHITLLQLEPRLREFCSRTGCTVGCHREDVHAEYPDDTQRWTAHVEADVERRRDRERTTLQAARNEGRSR
jgi:hypothetical protein